MGRNVHFKTVCLAIAAARIAFAVTPDELLMHIKETIARQDVVGARRQLESALKTYPEECRLYNFLGVVEAQDGKDAQAETAFRRAVQLQPGFTGAWLNLGRLYQENRAHDPKGAEKALGAYESVLKFEPANTEANYQAALLLQLRGFFRPSLTHLARMPADAQARPQALAVRLADLAGLGDNSQAEAVARRLIACPDLAEADVLSVLPTVEARGQQAIETKLLETLSSRSLASPDSLHRLAALYEQRKKFAQSRGLLEQASAAKPLSVPLLLDLARLAYLQQDFTGALGYLAHARDLEPSTAAIHFFFGMVSVELDLPLEARKSLLEAVRLDPENPWNNYAMGAVVAQGKDPGEAVPYLEKFCMLRPDDPRGRFALGVAWYEAKEYESAKRELAKIADKPETASGAHYFLGRIAVLDENLSLAAEELQKAISANPKYANAWAELGLVYMRQKDYEQSRKALDRALVLEPKGFQPNLNLLMLYQRTRDPRTPDQQRRFREIQKTREEKAKSLFRIIEVQPYR
jgi:tetratricopeptide (TPR) repeat protein